MKAGHCLGVCVAWWIASAAASAQSGSAASVVVAPALPAAASDLDKVTLAKRVSKPAPHSKLQLIGFADLPPVRKAVLELKTAEGTRHLVVAPGERRGELELLQLDTSAGRVSVRYAGERIELSISDRVKTISLADQNERALDASHSNHHRRRADLDRERDARDRQKAQ